MKVPEHTLRARINEGRIIIMANIYTSADQLIGKTPILELTHLEKSDRKSVV